MNTPSKTSLILAALLGSTLALTLNALPCAAQNPAPAPTPAPTPAATPAPSPAPAAPTPTPGHFLPTRFTVVDQGSTAAGTRDILLLPGLASSRDVWSAEAKLLSPTYRLHLVQINGFAGQPAGPNASGPILAPVVEELHQYVLATHIHPAVIGHSMGGLLGLMLAAAHPEDVSKLLIVDSLPFYGLVFSPDATVELVAPQARAMGEGMMTIPAAEFAASQPTIVAAMVKNPDAARLIAASSIASDRTVFVHAMVEDLGTDVRPTLATLKTPTTVLYPVDATFQKDPATVTALYTNAFKPMPNVTLHRIDDSRHFIMYDQPAALHTAIQTFLK